MQNQNTNWWRVAITLTALAYLLYYIETRADWHFIDNVNLIVHEAGHSILFFTGDLLQSLAGSLFQILVPLIFSLYFLIKKNHFSGYLLLFWVGQNLINVSVYAGDAIKMELPLLGGDSSIHDWNFILNTLGLIRYTDQISTAIFALGVFVVLAAAFLAILSATPRETKHIS